MSAALEGEPTCVAQLRRRAALSPDRRAFLYLPDGEAEGEALTYAELDARARAVAATLQAAGLAGERAILCAAPGLGYVAAFWGCLYAGVVAVPIDLPEGAEAGRRVAAIAADAGAKAVLAPESRFLPELPRLPLEPTAPPDAWHEPAVAPADLAFLQYTSGSTAAPKGVMITHANVLANQRLIHAAAGQGADAVFLSWLPLFHDMGLMGMVVQPVYVGAPCVLMPPRAFLTKPVRWLRAISRHGATISGGPDFAFALCAERIAPSEREGLDLSRWQVAYSGAEPVSAATLDRFVDAFGPVGVRREALYPCYGLAEATAFFTGGAREAHPLVFFADPAALAEHRAEPGGKPLVACGFARDGHELRVVDPATREPVPPGHVGEIWLAGGSVAAGYWGRPDDPTFAGSTAAGEGPYLRTGDLGFLHAGDIVICGRLKDLVIVRGRNHHPQDLEATVRASHPALAAGEGAAFTVPADGEERLCIVHELRPAHRDEPRLFEAVRQAVAAAHGVEVHAVAFIKRGALPKTSSGKVRRQAVRAAWLADELDALALETRVPAAPTAAPATADERRLAALWAEVLGHGGHGRDDDFFARGGDSIAAMRLVARIQDAWGVDLPLAALAEAPTIAALARAIAEARPTEPWPLLTPAPDAAGDAFPLNGIQLAYWLGRDADVGLGGVATHAYLELAFPALDVPRLEAALRRLVARHPMLRTALGPGPRQQVLAEAPAYAIAVRDVADEADVLATREAMSHQVLPADRWPLFDVRASRLPGGRVHLHVGVDLLIADAWSLRLAARELAVLYGDLEAPLPALDATFRDYVLAEAALAGSPARERAWAYWRDRLPSLPPPPDLPLPSGERSEAKPPGEGNRGTPGVPRIPSPEADASTSPRRGEGGRFVRRQTTLAPATWRALKRRAAAHGLTPTGVLLAAYARVLAAWNGGKPYTLNLTLFQRLPLHPHVDRLVGDFTSLTLLEVEAPGAAPFGDAARRLAARLWADLDHRMVSGLEVMRELARNLDRPTVTFPVVFTSTLVDGDDDAAGALPPGVEIAHAVSQTPQVTLDHQVHQLGGALHATWDALEAHFAPGVLDAMVAAHGALLHALAADDAAWGAAPSLLPADQAAAFAAANATDTPLPPGLLHQGFQARRAARPDALAVVSGARRWTYDEVGKMADALAWDLHAKGARPDHLVAIVMAKGWEQVVAALGILGAGAAYVPVDPGLPRERLHHLLAHAEATLVVTQPDVDARLDWPEGITRLVVTADVPEAVAPAPGAPKPADLAYVIYTSGSTGLPKGVMIDHQAAWNTVVDINQRFAISPRDRVLALSSLGFDLSVYDLFGLLAAGGAIVVPAPADVHVPAAWLALAEAEGVTVWNTVPALMDLLVDEAAERGRPLPASLRLAMLSGDWIPLALPGRIAEGVQVVSLGGATEAAIWSILHPIDAVDPAWRSVPYGRPMANQRFHVLDDAFQPAPAWVPGQLHIAGAGLALGYWRDPERTAAAFVVHPRTGERLYRTGDLGRYGPDGTIEFLGREDHQVKIAGHRIELGEVEAALLAHPGVRTAVVAPDGPARGARRLLAWAVPEGGEVDGEALRAFVAAKLPAYMVPARVLPLAELPLGPNGKVDRRRLTAPEAAPTDDAPRTEAERVLAALWAEVLEVPRVGRDDAFFELGGDSLAALRFLARLRARHGRELRFGDLFASPSLAELARAYEAAPTVAEIQPIARGEALPLSYAQERLWFLDQLSPGTAAYHVPLAVRVDGALDVPRLEAALAAVLARHEGLRAGFVAVDGAPVVRVAATCEARVVVEDLADEALLPMRLRAEAGRPFRLDAPPLLRARLFRLAEDRWVLALTLHHLVCDGWSLGLLLQELGAAYLGEPLAPPDAVQYADYAHWERTALAGSRLEAPLAYWRRQLAGPLPVLRLPTDRPRREAIAPPGATATFHVPAALTASLEALGRAHGATLFMVLLAGFKAWLHGLTGETDMLVAVAAANRRHVETERVIGLFVDTLALRTDLGGSPEFPALLARVREVVTGAQAHQELPLQRLVAALAPERGAGGVPAVRVGFGMQATAMPTLTLGGLELAPVPIETGAARTDLTMLVWKEPDGLRGAVEYRTDLFEASTIAEWLDAYTELLATIVATPEAPVCSPMGGAPAQRVWGETAGVPRPLTPPAADLSPEGRGGTLMRLTAIWEDLFDHRPIHPADDFFALGGHSLLAIRLMARVRREFQREIPLARLFEAPTIANLAAALDAPAEDVLVPMGGQAPALVVVHAIDGGADVYAELATRLPILAFQAPGLAGQPMPATLEDLAALYVARLREARPQGPYHLAGWSLGGLIAFEMACQLRRAGATVATLVLLDSWLAQDGPAADPVEALDTVPGALARAARAYVPGQYDGDLTYLAAADGPAGGAAPWVKHVRAVTEVPVPGDHFALPRAPEVAALLARAIAAEAPC